MSSLIKRTWALRREHPLVFYSVLHTLIFIFVFIPLSHLFYPGPGGLELYFAKRIFQGGVPYRDFQLEYPPLAILSFLLPSLVTRGYPAYSLAFAGEMLLFDFMILRLIKGLALRFGVPVNRAFEVYTVLLIAVGPIIVCRYDLLPAALTLAALSAFVSGWNMLTWTLLSLGVSAKLYPIIIAPVMGLYLLRNRQIKKIITGGILFFFTLLAVNLPFYLVSPRGFLGALTYHAQRGLQSESTYASVLFIGKLLGLTSLKGAFDFGSWNIDTPLADTLAKLSFPITAFLLIVIYIILAFKLWKRPSDLVADRRMPMETASLLVRFATAAVTVFMIATKVFSAQYLIWLMPLLPVVSGRHYKTQWLLFAVAGAITQFIFPYNYLNFEVFKTPYILLMVIRNAIMLALAFMLVFSGTERKKDM